MASIHRKAKGGTWYITYRQDGKQRHRSLGTTNTRNARRLKREIEFMLDEKGAVELVVSDRSKDESKNPTLAEFWEEFLPWAHDHRAPSTVDEYRNWFSQFQDFTTAVFMGDVNPSDVEAFKSQLSDQGKNKPQGVGLGVFWVCPM